MIPRIYFFITSLTLFVIATVLISMGILNLFHFASLGDIIRSFFYFDYYIVELGIMLLISLWFINQESGWRFVGYVLAGIFIIVSTIQVCAIGYGAEFVPAVAFENFKFIGLVVNKYTVSAAVVAVLLVGIFIGLLEKKYVVKVSVKILFKTMLVVAAIAGIVALDHIWTPRHMQDKIGRFFAERQWVHSAPVFDFVTTMLDIKQGVLGNKEQFSFTTEERERLVELQLPFNPDSEFYLIKDAVYDPSAGSQVFIPYRSQYPNVLVFFVEGFSARTIGTYNPEFKELTPNLDKFANESLVVKNYYNHTAATERGLRGQFCSIYPYFEKVSFHTTCLNNILNKQGYTTSFIDSDRSDTTSTDEIMKSIGINHAITGDDLFQFTKEGKGLRPEGLTDSQLFEALTGWIQTQNGQPFFVGVYNVGTHAFIDVDDSEEKYGDGSNHTLNTIHNFDRAFGKFWNEFKKTPLAKNTLVIITADHAHYPEPSYKELITDPAYQKLFIDQVPFIIHDPLKPYHSEFDAYSATSINFAPTLLHYLGISKAKNAFVGHSLFSKEGETGLGISGYDNNYYLIKDNTIISSNNPGPLKDDMSLVVKYIKSIYQAQMHQRVWDPQ